MPIKVFMPIALNSIGANTTLQYTSVTIGVANSNEPFKRPSTERFTTVVQAEPAESVLKQGKAPATRNFEELGAEKLKNCNPGKTVADSRKK